MGSSITSEVGKCGTLCEYTVTCSHDWADICRMMDLQAAEVSSRPQAVTFIMTIPNSSWQHFLDNSHRVSLLWHIASLKRVLSMKLVDRAQKTGGEVSFLSRWPPELHKHLKCRSSVAHPRWFDVSIWHVLMVSKASTLYLSFIQSSLSHYEGTDLISALHIGTSSFQTFHSVHFAGDQLDLCSVSGSATLDTFHRLIITDNCRVI